MYDITDYLYNNGIDDRLFSREKDRRVARENLYNILITSFMWINPIQGQEYTRNHNMNDLVQKWMRYYYKARIESNISISVTVSESGRFNNVLKRVRTELLNKHGYKFLSLNFNEEYLRFIIDALDYSLSEVSRKRIKFNKNDFTELDSAIRSEVTIYLSKLDKVEVR